MADTPPADAQDSTPEEEMLLIPTCQGEVIVKVNSMIMRILSALACAVILSLGCSSPLFAAHHADRGCSVSHQAQTECTQTGEETNACCPDEGAKGSCDEREKPDSHCGCDRACPSWWAALTIVGPLLSGAALLIAAWIAYCNLTRPARRREKQLIHTVFYHADKAIRDLEENLESIDLVRERIEQDESYHPYVVDTVEAALAYSQIIEVLQSVNDEADEEKILNYYYNEADLHAITKAFNSEIVRSFPQERKLGMWKIFEEAVRETRRSAKEARSTLAKLRSRRGK